MITSSGVPTWGGSFAKRQFKDVFKVVKKTYDDTLDEVEVVVLFLDYPRKEYTFYMGPEFKDSNKKQLADEIKRQLEATSE